MKNNFLIRDILPEDFLTLDKYFGIQTIYKKPKNQWEIYFNAHLNHDRIVKIIEVDHHAIGFGTLKFNSDYLNFRKNNIPEINDILIAPAYRRQGLGKSLVQTLENVAKEHDFKKIGLAVGLYQDYGPAQRLYVKMGYVPDGFGITYRNEIVTPGNVYPVDDELLLWLVKNL